MFDDYTRACAGIDVLKVLRREPSSPADPILFWEKVITWLPKLFQIKRDYEQLVREGRRTRAEMDEILRRDISKVYPPDYVLGTEQAELTMARCALAKARWRLQVAQTPRSVIVNPFPLHGLGQLVIRPAGRILKVG
jgi:hypothetical protein